MILSAPAGVGVVDDFLGGVVLRRERRGRVIQVGPLEHQFDREVLPGLAAVAGDEKPGRGKSNITMSMRDTSCGAIGMRGPPGTPAQQKIGRPSSTQVA